MLDALKSKVVGHVRVVDKNTGEVLLDKNNAIHPRNMGIAIARGLVGTANSKVHKLVLGNGGTTITSGGDIIYLSPRTAPTDNTIYNETYSELITAVDNSAVATTNPLPSIISKITIVVLLSSNEPAGQDPSDAGDGSDNINDQFVFDELGLMTQDNLLLSHLIFSPIEKTANRTLVITYTLTISVS
jgi:hypothetical protein